MYDVRETIFSDHTGQFPKPSLSNDKYSMVMVHIHSSSGILLKPIKSLKDAELTRAYWALMLHLQWAGVTPRKYVLDNEISDAMKNLICDEYKMELELVPPGCHQRNAAEVVIWNFRCHFLSILAGIVDNFPLKF